MCIDRHKVIANYIDPNDDISNVPDFPAEEWYTEHFRESQYLLQVVKCDDQQCCNPRRSSLHDLFLLSPYPIQVNGHPAIPDPEQHDGKTFATFFIRHCLPIQPLHTLTSMLYDDLYCPSLRHDIEKRCFNTCGIYFASIIMHEMCKHLNCDHRVLFQDQRLCASDKGLEWLNQNEVEGADDFIENYLNMLVLVVTLGSTRVSMD
ncbi:uncharacterized protein LOC130449665 [Diorhabda sublineata]|uniref:uncharacterized protein LOC130449665 n=1 Tax=Diorhabda sublineata TaxID=1163346 RepID=UPI0024E0E000|nr:uncharacterized protein LOC130449665 [Diorhabda sublineata]